MNTLKGLMLFFCTALILTSCASEKKEFERLFEEYKVAVKTKDASYICNNLDLKSKKMYIDIVDLTRLADSVRLARATYFAKYQAAMLRQKYNKSEIDDMDWYAACVLASEALDPSSRFLTGRLGTSNIKDDKAVFFMVINEKQTKSPFYFVRENGKWKVDLSKLYKRIMIMTGGFNSLKSVGSENENIKERVAAFYNEPIKPYLWTKPSKWPE